MHEEYPLWILALEAQGKKMQFWSCKQYFKVKKVTDRKN